MNKINNKRNNDINKYLKKGATDMFKKHIFKNRFPRLAMQYIHPEEDIKDHLENLEKRN